MRTFNNLHDLRRKANPQSSILSSDTHGYIDALRKRSKSRQGTRLMWSEARAHCPLLYIPFQMRDFGIRGMLEYRHVGFSRVTDQLGTWRFGRMENEGMYVGACINEVLLLHYIWKLDGSSFRSSSSSWSTLITTAAHRAGKRSSHAWIVASLGPGGKSLHSPIQMNGHWPRFYFECSAQKTRSSGIALP